MIDAASWSGERRSYEVFLRTDSPAVEGVMGEQNLHSPAISYA